MKATDRLLTDHKMIRKLLPGVTLDNSRYRVQLKTLSRAVLAHAWFEDEIFIPSFRRRKLLHKVFSQEIVDEHQHLHTLIVLLNGLDQSDHVSFDAYSKQFKAILETHLKKEEDALFPMAERLLSADGLLELGKQMEERKTEIRPLVKEYY